MKAREDEEKAKIPTEIKRKEHKIDDEDFNFVIISSCSFFSHNRLVCVLLTEYMLHTLNKIHSRFAVRD